MRYLFDLQPRCKVTTYPAVSFCSSFNLETSGSEQHSVLEVVGREVWAGSRQEIFINSTDTYKLMRVAYVTTHELTLSPGNLVLKPTSTMVVLDVLNDNLEASQIKIVGLPHRKSVGMESRLFRLWIGVVG
jgi:hypothetical protein